MNRARIVTTRTGMVIRAAIRMLRALPARLELEHLRWARRELDPLHPDLPEVIRRINHLEALCA